MLFTLFLVHFSLAQNNLIIAQREAGQIPIFAIVFAVMIVILILMLRLRMNSLGLSGPILVLDSANDVLEEDSPFVDLFEMIEKDKVQIAKEIAEEKKNKEDRLKKEKRKIGDKPLEYLKNLIEKKNEEVTKQHKRKVVEYKLSTRSEEFKQELESNADDIPESELRNVKFLAEGSYADIFVCEWDDQRVVVKKMKPEENVEYFLEEMVLMSRMNHPNIVPMKGCSFEPYYLVMEYFPRGSLYDTLHDPRTPPLAWPVIRQFALNIARGLQAMHTMKPAVRHRDLKSSNIMVSNNFTLKIADFSLSAPVPDGRNVADDSHAFGTNQWTAPEVLTHQHFTLAADVYSFAVVMWELMTRQIPYKGRNILSVISEVSLHGLRPQIPSPIPSNIHPDYVELMVQAWDQDPTKRPAIQDVVRTLNEMPSEPND